VPCGSVTARKGFFSTLSRAEGELAGANPHGILPPSLETHTAAWSCLGCRYPAFGEKGSKLLQGLMAEVSVDCNRYPNDEWHERTITPATANKPCHTESGVFQGNPLSLRAASAK